MGRTELVIQLIKVALGFAMGHVFRLVEPGSAAEIASALVRSFEHRARLCAQRYRQGSSEPFRPLGKKSFANR
jgi:hypothetical protein